MSASQLNDLFISSPPPLSFFYWLYYFLIIFFNIRNIAPINSPRPITDQHAITIVDIVIIETLSDSIVLVVVLVVVVLGSSFISSSTISSSMLLLSSDFSLSVGGTLPTKHQRMIGRQDHH